MRPNIGSLWKTLSTLNLPPTYFLYQYFPMDNGAREKLAESHQGEGSRVATKPNYHWLTDPTEKIDSA